MGFINQIEGFFATLRMTNYKDFKRKFHSLNLHCEKISANIVPCHRDCRVRPGSCAAARAVGEHEHHAERHRAFPGRMAPDRIWRRRIVVILVQAAPPFTISEIYQGIAAKTVEYELLPYMAPDTSYLFFNPAPNVYHYLCVAQQNDLTLTDRRAVGVASDSSGHPLSFNLQPGDSIVQDLYVNFDSLPAQPFIQ